MLDISSVKCRIIPTSTESSCAGDYASKVFQRYVSTFLCFLFINYLLLLKGI